MFGINGFFSTIITLGIIALVIIFLVEVLQGKNDNSWKILWSVIIILLNIIGILLYLFIGRKQLKGKKII